MVVSMTGFGRSRADSDRYGVTVEIKTVNHRFCEFHIRMPRQLMNLEDKIKKGIAKYIQRGRVEVYVTLEGQGTATRSVQVDWDLLDQYIQYISDIKEKYGLTGELSLQELVSREELIQIEEKESDNEELESLVLEVIMQAAAEARKMRDREGLALETDLKGNINGLKDRIDLVRQLAPLVVEQYRERLSKRMADFINGDVDESRILSEVAVFADKADINEELTRLESHIGQFYKILLLQEPVGRKLDFLVQEMNREVNTIGSKANDSKIAMEVVEMKSLLEKVKEQVQNIE
ncbi:YicC family protein [Mesobacillus foraminis]|uniref:YicC/YloC family endoribonuclease n=1 Tax=Mesobacillus foraminis TaxID=279826 RepID=UPI001BE5C043|nr:YicC/YloC family endoribonuclease [Mesobacillus foraminis]MBT2756072.1 YicC family protein [Mesobacillus foraminis]